jgi:hypothetical protein
MSDLDQLLDAAEVAGPGERIEFRDPIAAHGANAIAPLRRWLGDARLSAFAVRTLERIAAEPTSRKAVLDALRAADPASVPEPEARDVSDAIARLHGRPPSYAARADRPAQIPVDRWPGSRRVPALELRFHDAMLDIYRLAGEATRHQRPDGSTARGYWAGYFLRGVRNHGGPEYAHQLLRKQGTTDGFQRLTDEGRLDLTVEALVVRPEYEPLFTEDERRIAAHRLAEAGHMPLPRA